MQTIEQQAKQHYYAELGRKSEEQMLEKVRAGFPSGKIPLGYVRLPNGKVVIDESRAALIREAFFLVREGTSLRSALGIVSGHGLITEKGCPLGLSSFQSMVTNPFYCGMIRYGEELHPGRHQPLVNQALFAAVGDSLSKRRP